MCPVIKLQAIIQHRSIAIIFLAGTFQLRSEVCLLLIFNQAQKKSRGVLTYLFWYSPTLCKCGKLNTDRVAALATASWNAETKFLGINSL